MRHVEQAQVGTESHFREVLSRCVTPDDRVVLDRHVLSESLLVVPVVIAVGRLDGELSAEYVGQFGAEPVSTASDFLLLVVVVAGCEQVTKDHFWHVNALALVNLNRNASSVVPHADQVVLLVNVHSNLAHSLVSLEVIGSIY